MPSKEAGLLTVSVVRNGDEIIIKIDKLGEIVMSPSGARELVRRLAKTGIWDDANLVKEGVWKIGSNG